MIEFTFTPEFADYWRLNRKVLYTSLRTSLWIAGVLGVLGLLAVPMAFVGQQPDPKEVLFGILRALFIPGLFLSVFGMTHYFAKKRWRMAADLRVTRHYHIDERGITTKGDGFDGFLSWELIEEADHDSGWYYLKTAQNIFHYFPASVVPDSDTLNKLITNKVAKRKGLRH
jgi:hypothetical protein